MLTSWSPNKLNEAPCSVLGNHLALVVQMLDSTIFRINHYPVISIKETNNCTVHWIEIYLVDSTIHLLNNCGLVFIYLLFT